MLTLYWELIYVSRRRIIPYLSELLNQAVYNENENDQISRSKSINQFNQQTNKHYKLQTIYIQTIYIYTCNHHHGPFMLWSFHLLYLRWKSDRKRCLHVRLRISERTVGNFCSPILYLYGRAIILGDHNRLFLCYHHRPVYIRLSEWVGNRKPGRGLYFLWKKWRVSIIIWASSSVEYHSYYLSIHLCIIWISRRNLIYWRSEFASSSFSRSHTQAYFLNIIRIINHHPSSILTIFKRQHDNKNWKIEMEMTKYNIQQ